ncbi:amino acid adenylation domain-containing protein [Micromonospora sp. LOL_014]|uniref:amino acid adenylation domain-containing protein n=1 Tax=Micromonospora sp. LOL_014 TaxID=3345415 RepID=UPI003A88B7DA
MTSGQTMYEWFAASARRHPTNLALRADGVDLTYGQLATAVAALAERLVRHDAAAPPRAIGLLGSRTAGTYIGYLAAMRLGVPVVPLNPEAPAARHERIITMASVDLLLHTPSDHDQARQLAGHSRIRSWQVDDDPRDLPIRTADELATAGPGLDDLAYVVFTSGSTGTPKGVPVRHRNVAPWLSYVVEYFDAGPDCRISQTSDLSWDLSVFNVFVAWGSGGAVVVPARTDLLAPARHINEDGITHWFSTPASINMARWLGDLVPGRMPSLRWSLFGGEPLTVDNAQAWREAAPNSAIANVYGPTETTVTCLTYRLPDDPADWPVVAFGAVPLGPSYPTVECAVINDLGRPDAEGELLVRGPQRFDGYLDPADNDGRFVVWDGQAFRPDTSANLTPAHWYRTGDRVRLEHGRYAYLGRLDNQVKVNGYRIEPGEIEAVMRRCASVNDAVVVACTADDGTVELAGFYVSERPCRDALQTHLESHLPPYMIPRWLSWMSTLPLNLNGKVDRKRLAQEALHLTEA